MKNDTVTFNSLNFKAILENKIPLPFLTSLMINEDLQANLEFIAENDADNRSWELLSSAFAIPRCRQNNLLRV
jgi:hypothetical protein